MTKKVNITAKLMDYKITKGYLLLKAEAIYSCSSFYSKGEMKYKTKVSFNNVEFSWKPNFPEAKQVMDSKL